MITDSKACTSGKVLTHICYFEEILRLQIIKKKDYAYEYNKSIDIE